METSRTAAIQAVNFAGLQRFFEAVCRDAVAATGATRASIWYFEANGSIVCQRLLDTRVAGFQQGAALGRAGHEPYLDAITRDDIVAASDAASHPATQCFGADYFPATGITALLDVLVRDRAGRPAAILSCEETKGSRDWSEREILAVHNLARLVAGTLSYSAGTPVQRALFSPDLPFADEPVLVEAALYWAAKRSSRRMPGRDDISPVDMPRQVLPYFVLTELTPQPFTVRYLIVGPEMVTRFGRDFSGLTTADFMTGDYADYIDGLFRRVYDSAAPVYSESVFKWNAGGQRRTRRLMLPLADHDGAAGDGDGSGAVRQVMVAQVWPEKDAAAMPPSAVPLRADIIDNHVYGQIELPALLPPVRATADTAGGAG